MSCFELGGSRAGGVIFRTTDGAVRGRTSFYLEHHIFHCVHQTLPRGISERLHVFGAANECPQASNSPRHTLRERLSRPATDHGSA